MDVDTSEMEFDIDIDTLKGREYFKFPKHIETDRYVSSHIIISIGQLAQDGMPFMRGFCRYEIRKTRSHLKTSRNSLI